MPPFYLNRFRSSFQGIAACIVYTASLFDTKITEDDKRISIRTAVSFRSSTLRKETYNVLQKTEVLLECVLKNPHYFSVIFP